MKFYNRENELKELQTLWNQSDKCGKLAVLTGRRRLGKTLLAKKFTKDLPLVYLFIEKKPEALLCQEYLLLLQETLSLPVVGEIKRFKDLLTLLFEHAKQKKIVVILDEFQEFFSINPVVYSEIQNLWDTYKHSSSILLITVGSVYSLMHKIFEDEKEPLFGRADRIIQLAPFSIPVLSSLLKDHHISRLQELFDFYLFTGAVPKYLDMLLVNGAKSKEDILSFMLKDFSPFLEEGRYSLIEEFGKEYGIYFSILELISLGKTGRPEIESILGKSVGGYIEKLENTYRLIRRVLPFDEKPASNLIKFAINDLFLNFWFRFFYRNKSAVELKNFSYIRAIIDRDYPTYSGRILERFFIELLASQGKYNRIGTYWEAKNLNEIDIVAANDLEKKIFIAEVKVNPERHNLFKLQSKAQNLLKHYQDYEVEYASLSLKDAEKYLNGSRSDLV